MDSEASNSQMPLPEITDEFRGDNRKLCESIAALISVSDSRSLARNGIKGNARHLLAACYHRLQSSDLQAVSDAAEWQAIAELMSSDITGHISAFVQHPLKAMKGDELRDAYRKRMIKAHTSAS